MKILTVHNFLNTPLGDRVLMQYRVSFKFLRPVEKIAVSNELAAAVGAQRRGDIDHFRVEIADPLQFVFVVQVPALDQFRAFNDHKRIDALALPFRNRTEYDAREFRAPFGFFYPDKLQLVPQVEFAVEVFEPLIEVGQVGENSDRLFIVVGKPNNSFIHHRFHFFEHQDHLFLF